MTNQFDDYDPNVFLGGRSSIREPLAPIGGNFLRDLQTFWRGINRNTFAESEERRQRELERNRGVAGKVGAAPLWQEIAGKVLGEGLMTLGPRGANPASFPRQRSISGPLSVPENTPTVRLPDPIAAPANIARSANENIHPNFRTDEFQYMAAVDRQNAARNRVQEHPFEVIEGGPNARPSLDQRALAQFNEIRRQAGEQPISMEEFLQNRRFYDSELPGRGHRPHDPILSTLEHDGPDWLKGPRGSGPRRPSGQQPFRQAYVRESFNPPIASDLTGPQISTLNRVGEWLRNSNVGYQMHASPDKTVYVYARHPITNEQVSIRVSRDGHYGLRDADTVGNLQARQGGPGNFFDTGHRVPRSNLSEPTEVTRNISGEQYAIPEVLEQALSHRFSASPTGQFLTSPGTEPVYGQPTGSIPLTGHTIWPRGRGPNMERPRPERITLAPRQQRLPGIPEPIIRLNPTNEVTKGPTGRTIHITEMLTDATRKEMATYKMWEQLNRASGGRYETQLNSSLNRLREYRRLANEHLNNSVLVTNPHRSNVNERIFGHPSEQSRSASLMNPRDVSRLAQRSNAREFNLPGWIDRPPRTGGLTRGPRDDNTINAPDRVTTDQIVEWLNRSGVENQVTPHRGGTQYLSAINPHSRGQDSIIIRVSPEGHIGRGPERRSHEVGRRFDTGDRLVQPHHREDTRITRNVSGESYSSPENLFDALRHRLSVDPEGQFLVSPGREPVYRTRGTPTPPRVTIPDRQLNLDLNIPTVNPRRGWSGSQNTKGLLSDLLSRNRPETVTEAVVRIGGREFSGRTHADALMRAERELGAGFESALGSAESLFRTNRGNVVSREEAMRTMQRANSRFNEVHNRLTSEDLIDLDPNYGNKGLSGPPRQRSDLLPRMTEMYNQGTSAQSIARELGVATNTVTDMLRESGVTIRGTSARHPALSDASITSAIDSMVSRGWNSNEIAFNINRDFNPSTRITPAVITRYRQRNIGTLVDEITDRDKK